MNPVSFSQLLTDLHGGDPFLRRSALSVLASEPEQSNIEIFEDALTDSDPYISMLGLMALRKLYPVSSSVDSTWQDLFGESVDLLSRRASFGPVPVRTAALQALAFAPTGLTTGLVQRILEGIPGAPPLIGGLSEQPPILPLVNSAVSLDLPQVMGMLFSALPHSPNLLSLFRRELSSGFPEKMLPVLFALQMNPIKNLVEDLVSVSRSIDPVVAIEGARALLACGGSRIFVFVLSLLKETADHKKKVGLLPLLARTGRDEVWPLLLSHLKNESWEVRKSAVFSIARFAASENDRSKALSPIINDENPFVASEAAIHLWHLGSMDALHKLERMLNSDSTRERSAAAAALGQLPASVSLPLLADRLGRENQGDTLREIMISMRRLIPKSINDSNLIEWILLTIRRLLSHSDPFLKSQAAVLCGLCGSTAEDLILPALEKQEHPHVIASLIAALKGTGTPRLLVLARFHDHPETRVRANLMETLLLCGASAIPYLGGGLKDPSPRVRSAAAVTLFALGQIEVVAHLNRMLLTNSSISVLASCFALGRLMRFQPPTLGADHPLSLALGRESKRRHSPKFDSPAILQEPSLPIVFTRLAKVKCGNEESIQIIEQARRDKPNSHPLKRLLASFLINVNKPAEALAILESCLRDKPSILADLFDVYRLSVTSGDPIKVEKYGRQLKETYQNLFESCKEELRISGKNADMNVDLLKLSSPSMNLYSYLIKLQTLKGDRKKTADYLAELLLARPANKIVAEQLAKTLLDQTDPLKETLRAYSASLTTQEQK
ncbi:MAG: HEAT repeat domain-containing protein [Candidatus Riflebacteria bacterium]|nr:HEAT repeat domain-containing protein [Candidatus Riflebacteria bacterium]